MKTEMTKSASGVGDRYCMCIFTLKIILPVSPKGYFIIIVSCLPRRDSESTNILIT